MNEGDLSRRDGYYEREEDVYGVDERGYAGVRETVSGNSRVGQLLAINEHGVEINFPAPRSKNKNKTTIRSAQAVYLSTHTTLTAGRSVTKATATNGIGEDQQDCQASKIRLRFYLLRSERRGIQTALSGGVQLHRDPCQRRVVHAVWQPPDRQRAVLAADIDRITLQRDLPSVFGLAPREEKTRRAYGKHWLFQVAGHGEAGQERTFRRRALDEVVCRHGVIEL